MFRERAVDRLRTEEVVAALGERLGRPITANRLARTLKPYGARPRQFRLGGKQTWGYILADVAAAAARGRDGELSGESRGSVLSGESGDAQVVVEPLVPAAAEPRVGSAVPDPLDASREWNWRLALAMGH